MTEYSRLMSLFYKLAGDDSASQGLGGEQLDSSVAQVTTPKEQRELIDLSNEIRQSRIVSELGIVPNPHYSPDIGLSNILAGYDSLSEQEKIAWGGWYDMAHQQVQNLASQHGVPFPVAAGVTAVLSPSSKWNNNLRNAGIALSCVPEIQQIFQLSQDIEGGEEIELQRQALEQNIASKMSRISTFPVFRLRAREMIEQWLRGEEIVVPGKDPIKIRDFLRNISFPQQPNPATVDGHAINIWLGSKVTLKEGRASKKLKAIIQDTFGRAAEARGIKPQSMQAVTWYVWKNVTNE